MGYFRLSDAERFLALDLGYIRLTAVFSCVVVVVVVPSVLASMSTYVPVS